MKKTHASRISSSDLNTLSYVARAKHIANAVKEGRLSFVDKLSPRDWRQSDWNYEVDRLQYNLAYSNSEQYCPEDLLSLARGREVTAELLEEKALTMKARATILFRRADALQEQSVRYWCVRYYEEAKIFRDEAEYLENEANRDFDRATDCRRTADYFYGKAENVLKEDLLISKWEELYDMM